MNIVGMSLDKQRSVAGSILFVVGAVALLGIITAEVLYPGYSTLQEISDLGASRPPNSVIHQPAATVFNFTMLLSGGLLLIATYFVHRIFSRLDVSFPLALFGLGIFGVGVFPGNITPWHQIFAFLTFVSGGFAVLLSSRIAQGPFKYLSICFGGFSLIILSTVVFLGDSNPLLFLDLGGIERWVVYPLVLWITGFGGYLLGGSSH